MIEEWRDIKGYEGKYQVSNLGRVKSLNYNHTKKEKILSDSPNTYGYLYVNLYKNGKGKPFYIHKLVALHFIPNPNNHPIINHKDENKQNNKVSNLEWCTHEYNVNYGTRTQRASEKMKGSKNPMYDIECSKHPRARKVLCVTTGKEFNTIKEASESYNLHMESITMCCQGKRKSAGKHPETGERLVWRYCK